MHKAIVLIMAMLVLTGASHAKHHKSALHHKFYSVYTLPQTTDIKARPPADPVLGKCIRWIRNMAYCAESVGGGIVCNPSTELCMKYQK